MISVSVKLQWYNCGVNRVRVVKLERFKRLVYTLHPKATSLRMHSMRKRRVTTKFTMVKKSNKTGGALWYYKIHPTHRRNTTQILIYSVVHLDIYHMYICIYFYISLSSINYNLCIWSLISSIFRPSRENCYWIYRRNISLRKINQEICFLVS